MGEIMNNYDLLLPFQSENAGFSRWTIARKNGIVYFLKEFMNPVYPIDSSISEELKKEIIAACIEYENNKKQLYESIGSIVDGNIIKIHEFFRYDSRYYISTDRVDSEKVSFEEIAALPMEDKVLLCTALAHSVMMLHKKKIIHSDIKASNVLLKKTSGGKLIGKLIDFDCGFFESNQPKSEAELSGDQVYLAPEACRFMCGDEVQLTTKLDVFALGVLFHQYMTGETPGFDESEYYYAHEAVLDEQELVVSDSIPEKYRELIKRMLICDPDERCDMEEVFLTLSGKEAIETDNASEEQDVVSEVEVAVAEPEVKETKKFSSSDFFMTPDMDDLL